MCGRYTLGVSADALHDFFGLADVPEEFGPRYNIAPTQEAAVVRVRDGDRRLDPLHWGLVPPRAPDLSKRGRHINARSETVSERRAYAEGYRKRRCLVPADGFYEWRAVGRQKQPSYFHLPERSPFGFAGLWSRWRTEDEPAYESFTIITMAANETVAPVHDRMPVILRTEAFGPWLDPANDDPEILADLQRLHQNDELVHYPVSQLVNYVANDSPRCIESIDPSLGQATALRPTRFGSRLRPCRLQIR